MQEGLLELDLAIYCGVLWVSPILVNCNLGFAFRQDVIENSYLAIFYNSLALFEALRLQSRDELLNFRFL